MKPNFILRVNNEIVIRLLQHTDLDKLSEFFKLAYGEETIFLNKDFLKYYFNSVKDNGFNHSVIAVKSNGDIISHYGGLLYQLRVQEKIFNIVWGVNAFTLPEWRGLKLNSSMVQYFIKNNDVNATIGMSPNTIQFYQKLGYNTFYQKRFKRFVYVLNTHAFDVSTMLGFHDEKVRKLLKNNIQLDSNTESHNIIELTKNNYKKFSYQFGNSTIVTTNRSKEFLNWRLFNNPFIEYKVYGYLKNDNITAYIAVREEVLNPYKFVANRIIDLYGNSLGVSSLLKYIISEAQENQSIYIDFSMFGLLYEEELTSIGFNKLEEDDVCILPMVTFPVEKRPNYEFIAIQSKLNIGFEDFTAEDVYFTRIDSDRDRIANIQQLSS